MFNNSCYKECPENTKLTNNKECVSLNISNNENNENNENNKNNEIIF